MALAIDASTPLIATNAVGSTATVTSPSFTPPAGSLLLNLWSGNSSAATNPGTPTISDSLGAPLTYTLEDWQSRADSPTRDGQAAAWAAPVGSSAAMTVTVTSGVAGANKQSALQVVVLTGQHATPIGAHGKSGSSSAASIAQSYTATATGSWGFIVVCDWDALGNMTAGTGCTLIATGTIPTTQISYGVFRRTTADGVNGNSTTLNVNLAGTSTNVSWTYAEVVPAAGAASGQAGPPLVVEQALTPTFVRPIVTTPTIGPPQVIRLPQITVLQFPRVLPAPFPIAVNPPFPPPQVRPLPPIVVAAQARLPQAPTITVSPSQIPSTTILSLTTIVVAQQFSPAAVDPIVLTPPFLTPPVTPAQVLVAPQQFSPAAVDPIVLTPAILPSGQPVPAVPIWINPSRTQPFLPAVVAITPPPLPQAPAPITVTPSRPQPALAAVITLVPAPLPQALPPIVVVASTWQPRQPQISLSQPTFAAAAAGILPPRVLSVILAPRRVGPYITTLTPALLPPDLGVGKLPPITASTVATAIVTQTGVAIVDQTEPIVPAQQTSRTVIVTQTRGGVQ